MNVDGTTPVLADEQMRALGFTDHVEIRWYLCTRVGPGVTLNVTLNVTIDKSTGQYEEYVLDEDFGQPAYYGRMVDPYRTDIREAVDRQLARLREAGLDITVDHRLYGVEA